MKKNTYIVYMNNNSIVHEYEAHSIVGAMIKAVLQFSHLSVKFSTINKVEKAN